MRSRREAELREAYFARVRPVLGEGLARQAVALRGAALPLLARSLELLAGCCLGRIVVRGPTGAASWPLPQLFGAAPGEDARALFLRSLRFKNPFSPPRLVTRGRAELELDAELGEAGSTPVLRWSSSARRATLRIPAGDLFAHQELSYALARDARDALLGNRPFPDGERHLGDARWPFAVSEAPPPQPPPPARARLEGAHLLVVGCGSVGSEAVRLLAPSGARLSLVDGGRVSIFNPHRQWFGAEEVGELKARALARRLGPGTRALALELTPGTLARLEELLERDSPAAVLLATGTSAHALAAPLLWRRRIPHLAACAYPRARFFELVLVSPEERTPCLACLRDGALDRGPEPALPVDDELGRFLYEELAPGERERRWHELVAEPATPIETGRIADLAARCLCELALPAGERSPWLRRLSAEGTTCLIGGNQVLAEGGELAYGIRYPGQVVRLGLGDLRSASGRACCGVCGRRFRAAPVVARPEADLEAIDRALLARG